MDTIRRGYGWHGPTQMVEDVEDEEPKIERQASLPEVEEPVKKKRPEPVSHLGHQQRIGNTFEIETPFVNGQHWSEMTAEERREWLQDEHDCGRLHAPLPLTDRIINALRRSGPMTTTELSFAAVSSNRSLNHWLRTTNKENDLGVRIQRFPEDRRMYIWYLDDDIVKPKRPKVAESASE